MNEFAERILLELDAELTKELFRVSTARLLGLSSTLV